MRNAFLSREIAPKPGALGRVIDAYLDSGFDPVEFDARLEVCDPILVDRWLETAVPACLLGLQERLGR